MADYQFLERDDDLLSQLTATQRGRVESMLTSHAIEGFEPKRHHTEAVIDFILDRITADELDRRLLAHVAVPR